MSTEEAAAKESALASPLLPHLCVTPSSGSSSTPLVRFQRAVDKVEQALEHDLSDAIRLSMRHEHEDDDDESIDDEMQQLGQLQDGLCHELRLAEGSWREEKSIPSPVTTQASLNHVHRPPSLDPCSDTESCSHTTVSFEEEQQQERIRQAARIDYVLTSALVQTGHCGASMTMAPDLLAAALYEYFRR